MERSTDGTLKNMYGCIKTNIRFSKARSSTGMLVPTSGPKSGICWMVSRPMSWIPQRGRSGLLPPYKTTSTTASPCFKTSSTTSGRPPPVLPPLHRLGLNGSETMVRRRILSPACWWMISIILVRSTPCCLRPRNLA